MDFNRLIEISKALKNKKPENKQFHVCFIMNKNRIVQIGLNDYRKTHPKHLQGHYVDKYGNNRSHLVGLHAECDALIKLGETDCSGYSFVNIRITPMNKVGYACYCNGCYNLLKQVGYKKLYFSYDDAGNFNQIV